MRVRKVIQRFLMPGMAVTAYYLFKFGCQISPRAEVEVSHRLKIGKGAQIGSFTKIKATDGDLVIGENVNIGTSCFISADAGGVYIGDDCLIGHSVCIVGNNYRFDQLDVPVRMQAKTSNGIRIGKDVWLGAGVIVLDGAIIGDHCIVAPNSVVSSTLPQGVIAQGNPAVRIFDRR